MPWLLLLVSILFASVNSVLLHKLPAKSDLFLLNLICSGVWILLLFSLNGFSVALTPSVLLWGVLYGVTQEMFLFFKAQAMKSGPVSLTTLIGNCSLILSTPVGILVWQESVSVPQLIGIGALILAFVFCTYKKGEKAAPATKKWFLYCLCFFTLAAGVGILFKAFSKAEGGEHVGDMMLVAAVVMLLFAGIKLAVRRCVVKGEAQGFEVSRRFVLIALINGVLGCCYNRLNISLAGKLESAVFYPCFNGGVILLSTLLGLFFLRERLTRRQAVGLALGIAAVVTVGIF